MTALRQRAASRTLRNEPIKESKRRFPCPAKSRNASKNRWRSAQVGRFAVGL
jgi:hypothetical protein